MLHIISNLINSFLLYIKEYFNYEDNNHELMFHDKNYRKLYKERIGVDHFRRNYKRRGNVIVGVIDSGIFDHKEFSNNPIIHSGQFCSLPLRSFHGTHVAGIIRNICPEAILIDYRGSVNGNENALYKAMYEAYERDVDIANISVGNSLCYSTMSTVKSVPFGNEYISFEEIINKFKERGILVVLTSGNGASITDSHNIRHHSSPNLQNIPFLQILSDFTCDPEKFSNGKYSDFNYFERPEEDDKWQITVSSCSCPKERNEEILSKFNSLNRSVTCCSYGEEIYSTSFVDGRSNYTCFSGTSMAVPHVSGVLANLILWFKYEYPNLDKITRAHRVKDFMLKRCCRFNLEKISSGISGPSYLENSYKELQRCYNQRDNNKIQNCLRRFKKQIQDIIEVNPEFYIESDFDIFKDAQKHIILYEQIKRKFALLGLGNGIVDLNGI